MPGLNSGLMLLTARDRFSRFQLRLPPAGGERAPQLSFATTAGTASHAISGREPRGAPLPCPPALFVAASNDPRDIERQRVSSEPMDQYLRRVCDAIAQAHDAWRMQARLVQVTVNAVTAMGGRLEGVALEPEIRLRAPRENAWQRTRSEAIAAGIGFCWENWQRSVSVPGMPWYPAFAAFPGPMAPPTPNVPVPLAALVQNPVLLTGAQLKFHMSAHYNGDNEWPNELFEAVAAGVERAFQIWIPSQMVMNVLATGPVPTFAPPYVPVGPVVGGTGNQVPGAWSV